MLLQEIRTTMKSYDTWIDQFGIPSSILDLPGFELVLFIANAIARGELLKDFNSADRMHVALSLLSMNAGLEQGCEINMDLLGPALGGNASFGELLQICAGRRKEAVASPAVMSQQPAEAFAGPCASTID